MGELGVTGMRISLEYGGVGADCVSTGIASEEIARGDFNCGYAVMVNGLLGEMVEHHATEQVKEAWLPPLAKGEKILGICLTEPECGSDAAALQTRADKRGDEYVINGQKSSISFSTVADAFIVFDKTNPAAGARGISAFMVPADSPGLERTDYQDMGSRMIHRGSVFFDDVRVPVENLIGEENQGFYKVMNGFDMSRAYIAMMCIGAAQTSLEETIAYTKTRKAFQIPLAKYESVSFPISEYWAKLDMIRWYSYRALWLRDNRLPHTKEAAAIRLGPKVAAECIHECLLLHGHYGYSQDMPLEQRLRDVIGLELGDGTANIQKVIIGRELFGKEYWVIPASGCPSIMACKRSLSPVRRC